MGYIWMAFVGLLVGALAKLLLPGKDPGGIVVTALVGIAGTFLGFYLKSFIMTDNGEFDIFHPADWIFSIGGSILILLIWKKLLAPMFSKSDSEEKN